MSRFVDEADAAYRRWRDMQATDVHPIVRVVLAHGEIMYFNGLAIAPAGVAPDVVSLSSVGLDAATVVVRDQDIRLIEIEPLGP